MPARGGLIDVDIRGLRRVERALEGMPADAATELRQAIDDVVAGVAGRTRAAGLSDTRQSAAAAQTVRVEGRRVVAGPERRLYGSEFGMERRSGWYAQPQYEDSLGRQYRPHRGSASYWFFRAQEDAQPWVETQWAQIHEGIVRRWSA